MPVDQTPRYLVKGWFDHDAHKETGCADCHTKATGSKAASDLLVPGLRQCRDCHVGETGDADELSGHEILRKPFTVAGLADAAAAALDRRSSELPPASAA